MAAAWRRLVADLKEEMIEQMDRVSTQEVAMEPPFHAKIEKGGRYELGGSHDGREDGLLAGPEGGY